MQLIPAGPLALSVHLALALGQPAQDSAEPSAAIRMRTTNKESGNIMANPGAPIMKMPHDRKWVPLISAQQHPNHAAIERKDGTIEGTLSPFPSASGIVTLTTSVSSTCSTSPSTTPTPPADYGDYSGYGDYGHYGNYGDYDDVVSQVLH